MMFFVHIFFLITFLSPYRTNVKRDVEVNPSEPQVRIALQQFGNK